MILKKKRMDGWTDSWDGFIRKGLGGMPIEMPFHDRQCDGMNLRVSLATWLPDRTCTHQITIVLFFETAGSLFTSPYSKLTM